jgi:membrane protein DedA with SNARE-associated domain
MWWQYTLVFLGGLLMDITPLPLPPAFTIMILFQIIFGLPIWPVIVAGVIGSIAGRYILTLYIPAVSKRVFKTAKNEDIQFLGNKLKTKGWKSQLFILLYTLMPLPSTPLFVAAGIAKMKPLYIFPAFLQANLPATALLCSWARLPQKIQKALLKVCCPGNLLQAWSWGCCCFFSWCSLTGGR